MWHQLILLAAILSVSAVQGLCTDVPGVQQLVTCPPPKIYSTQLCDCLEPHNAQRHPNEISQVHKLSALTGNYIDPVEALKNKLDMLRHRLSVSLNLPDTSVLGQGNSVGSVPLPLLIYPDRHVKSTSSTTGLMNHVPRSWPARQLLRPTQAMRDEFGPTMDRSGRLSLAERLRAARNQWRKASVTRAHRRFGNAALAHRFLNNLPSHGVAPESNRDQFHLEAGPVPSDPDNHSDSSRNLAAVSLHSIKTDSLPGKTVKELLPKAPTRGTISNSYTRGLMRLRSSKVFEI